MSSHQSEHENTADRSHNLIGQPHFRQFALQAAAAFAVLSLAWPYFGIKNEALPWPWVAATIGGVALALSIAIHLPWWWRLIHAAFAPMAWWISTQNIAPGWFLFAFFLLLLVYRGAVSGQIPLYFSNRATTQTIAELIPESSAACFVDLGAGIGSVLRPLAVARLNAHFTGLENAPATWLVARLLSLGLPNCNIRMTDFWQEDLSCYNIVYAFLSPAPMSALWEKVGREMQPGSLFISNSFAVPDVAVSRVIEVGDARQTKLYCYQR